MNISENDIIDISVKKEDPQTHREECLLHNPPIQSKTSSINVSNSTLKTTIETSDVHTLLDDIDPLELFLECDEHEFFDRAVFGA